MSSYYYPEERIAVVAMGGFFPDAGNVDMLWNNILSKKVSIREIPDSYFDKKVFYKPEVFGKSVKNNKTYTKVGAVLDKLDYTPFWRKYKIPPAVAEHMDNNQHVAIYSVDQALQQLRSDLPRERTAVIINTGTAGKKFEDIVKRDLFDLIENRLLNNPDLASGPAFQQIENALKRISGEVLKDNLPVTEDSAPGFLQNITAGRIANIFDIWGPSYTVDSACASALTAVSLGVAGLLNNEYDAVVTGGVEVSMSETGLVAFSGINALSSDGEFPFDSRANGFVMGLGGGILILKRLSDALRDGDFIFSIISGYGQGSDGKGKYIAAPSEDGQVRVIEKACRMSGYPVDTIELIEAHGTGTVVGDVVEISAMKEAFNNLGATRKNYCGVGSIKSNIGHLRNAAGTASLIKTSLALHNKILPPTANIININPKLGLEGSPFYILTDGKPWKETGSYPRRANVSAYGFGGADYHICLEEFRPEFLKKTYPVLKTENIEKEQNTIETKKTVQEVVLFSGNSFGDIKDAFLKFTKTCKDAAEFSKACFLNNSFASVSREWRVAFCSRSIDELNDKWSTFDKYVNDGNPKNTAALNIKGIFFEKGEICTSGKTAFMFPGQASQYPNMLSEIYENYPVVESFYMQTDAIWKAKYGYSILPLIFGTDEEQMKDQLKNTRNTHPAMFLSNIALFKLLSESGVKADYMIGHSLGEITALYAGGMFDLKSALYLIGARGFSFDSIPENERGQMVSVKLDKESLLEIIEQNGFNVSIANINSPEQTVAGGTKEEINRLADFLAANKVKCAILNVSHAFHTGIIRKAAENFHSEIKDTRFNVPKAKIMCCHQADFYSVTNERQNKIPEMLRDQVISPVNFADSVLKLYERGVRLFIEAGPSSVLSNLVKVILAGRDVRIVSSNNKSKDSVEAFNQTIAELFTCGMDIAMVPGKRLLGLPEAGIGEYYSNKKASQLNTPAASNAICANTQLQQKESLVYSGVSVGLPGSFKKAFSDDNFEIIFEGKNLIERLTDDEQNSILDLNITRLIKTEGVSAFKKITSMNEVIKLAAKFGQLDMINDYMIDEKMLKQSTVTVCAGIAAGYEALKDAGIPLVREYIKTSSGASLPGRWVLPADMRDDTGIIFANGLSIVDPVIDEVSKYIASKFGRKTRNDLTDFYEAVISRVSDNESKRILTDWFTLHYSRLMSNGGEGDVYEFNHNFLLQLHSFANNRLAQLIGAAGPNFYVGAACASTSSSVTIAEDLIRAGHARRFIVVGADIANTKQSLPWFGAGFMSRGFLNDSKDLFSTAVPFDKRRNGTILGAGAVGLIIEKEKDVAKRGMNGICRILGTHAFNTAGHQSRIDSNKFCIELDKFFSKMESEYGMDRSKIAAKTVYCAHETYSPGTGGCAETEKMALEKTFGEKFRELKVISTKGITGHTIGASIEEAVAAKALQYQRTPPIVNYREPDPKLEGLNLSQGGSYKFDYVLRTVIASGGQGTYHLLQGIAHGDERITDEKAYREWLEGNTLSNNPELKYQGRILTAEGEGNFAASVENTEVHAVKAGQKVTEQKNFEVSVPNNADITESILEVFSQVTKYPKEMLDLSMELEADLGIDTVKQATIFSMISEKFGLSQEEGIQLSNYPTIGHVVNLLSGKAGASNTTDSSSKKEKSVQNNGNTAAYDYENDIYKVISEITKYPPDMLDKDMELEADLGIDTVKQATIFSIIGEKFNISEDKMYSVSQYRTIGQILGFMESNVDRKVLNPVISDKNDDNNKKRLIGVPGVITTEKAAKDDSVLKIDGGGVLEQVLELISWITKYPVEMLDRDMELEADLGIDTIKQATILSSIGDRFGMPDDISSKASNFRTIGSIVDMIEEALKGSTSVAAENLEDTAYSEAATAFNDTSGIDEQDEMELCIQVPVFVEEKIGPRDYDLKDRNIWIIGDSASIVQSAAACFKKVTGHVEKFVFDGSLDIAELEERVSNLTARPVDVIADMSLLGTGMEYEKLSRDEEKRMLFINSEARFIFYKKLSETISDPEIRIVCIVSMDGCHGHSKQDMSNMNPFMGALSGFYKGLGKEWRKSKVKIVDSGTPENVQLMDKVVSNLVDEIEASSDDCEIGYRDGRRFVFKVNYFDRNELKGVKLPDFPHFVIVGGGYGIAAEIARGLSKKIKGRFTIIGRTELPQNIMELTQLTGDQLEQKKVEIRDNLKKSGITAKPVMVEKEYEKIIKAVSIYKLINSIRANGSEVLYFNCDVRDYESMEVLLGKAVEKNGPINVVIHAAGVEKSRLLTQKTHEEFREVFSVKALGFCNLCRLVGKKELKVLASFSSISGRFGNEAQLDYCAANNFLASFTAMFKSIHSGVSAFSIDWSGWKDTGMAWRNEFVKQHSEEMGINLIEPDRGTSEFIKILTGGVNESEIIVSKGLTHFISPEMIYGNLNETPQIDWVTKRDGKIEKVFKVLSVKRDPIINNHRLGATPLMPAVGFMEIFAEYHSLLFGKKEQYCFRNLRFDKPLKLFHEKPQEIVLVPHFISEPDSFEGVFYNYFQLKHGNAELIELNRMQISGNIGDYSLLLDIRDVENEDMIELTPEERVYLYSNSDNAINLGSLFADEYCRENNVFKYNKSSSIFSIFLSGEQVTNRNYHLENLLVNPVFMDSMMQICGFHSLKNYGKVYLPWKIGELGVVRVPREVKCYWTYARLKESTNEVKTYDVIMFNESKEVCYYAMDVKMRYISQ